MILRHAATSADAYHNMLIMFDAVVYSIDDERHWSTDIVRQHTMPLPLPDPLTPLPVCRPTPFTACFCYTVFVQDAWFCCAMSMPSFRVSQTVVANAMPHIVLRLFAYHDTINVIVLYCFFFFFLCAPFVRGARFARQRCVYFDVRHSALR